MTTKKPDLLLLTPRFGAPSETFIQRHVEALTDGEVLSFSRQLDLRGSWDAAPPILLDERKVSAARRQRIATSRIAQSTQGIRSWKPSSTATAGFRKVLEQHPQTPLLLEFLDQWIPLAESAAMSGRVIVAHGHGYDVSIRLRSRLWRKRYKHLSEFAHIVVMSEYCKNRLVDECRIEPSAISTIPYGVNLPREVTHGTDSGPLRVLMVGRLVGKKNPLPLLAAVNNAISSGHEIQLDILGDGPLREATQRFIADHPLLAKNTKLHGVVPNSVVLDKLRESQVFALNCNTVHETGEEEGLPVAILEAMAAGRAIVSTRHAGVPEAVIDGHNGFLAGESDVAGFQSAFETLAGTSGLAREMGDQSHRIAAAKFDWRLEKASLREALGLTTQQVATGQLQNSTTGDS